ncbi:MAG: hypothetical protein ACRDHE_16385, partial [Ktedonobacterales bacterium]
HALAVRDNNEGKQAAAREGYERSLAIARELGDPNAIASDLSDLGELLARTGEPQRGRQLLTEALGIFTELGAVYDMGVCHEYWARLDERAGDRAGAIQRYRQALPLYERAQAADEIARVREALRRLGAG